MQIKIFIYTENYILVDKDSFWPHHLKTNENVYALLILDNCSAHKHLYDSDLARKFVLPDNLCIIFLPLNLTSCIEPADMGIIEVFKVVCKLFIIRSFLADMGELQIGSSPMSSCIKDTIFTSKS